MVMYNFRRPRSTLSLHCTCCNGECKVHPLMDEMLGLPTLSMAKHRSICFKRQPTSMSQGLRSGLEWLCEPVQSIEVQRLAQHCTAHCGQALLISRAFQLLGIKGKL